MRRFGQVIVVLGAMTCVAISGVCPGFPSCDRCVEKVVDNCTWCVRSSDGKGACYDASSLVNLTVSPCKSVTQGGSKCRSTISTGGIIAVCCLGVTVVLMAVPMAIYGWIKYRHKQNRVRRQNTYEKSSLATDSTPASAATS